MKLEINKSYILFTNSDYILNKKIRVLSYMNYDRASEYASFTENVAINEKFIDSSGDADYLKKQIFYDCGVIKLEDGEWKLTGETVIVWDDIIDTDRTQRLYEDYIYKLNFKFKDISDTDIISYEDYFQHNYDYGKKCFIDELESYVKFLGNNLSGYTLSTED